VSEVRPNARVLVVDDDPALLRVVSGSLEARGYTVTTATTGRDALDSAWLEAPDVILLDLGLPDIDGVEVCRHLRTQVRAPIIVLTADGAEDRKVRALDQGADDYVTKPFSTPELLARVRVALRHRDALAAIVDDGHLTVGALDIDFDARTVVLGTRPVDLTPKEFALLALLARNVGKVLTHRAILDTVWGSDHSLDTLRTHVLQVRRKLDKHPGAPKLSTAQGVGYRLDAPGDAAP
jgi:two-component system, OmpR family, KDP operon response regulator KdpE